MIIGIYSLKISDINGLSFYRQRGSQEIGDTLPSSVKFTDDNGSERICSYDQAFSKEVGHHAYVYMQEANIAFRPAPTPISDTDVIPAKAGDVNDDTSGTGNADGGIR